MPTLRRSYVIFTVIALALFNKKSTIYLTNIFLIEYFKKNIVCWALANLTTKTFFLLDKFSAEYVLLNNTLTSFGTLRTAGQKHNITNLTSVLVYVMLLTIVLI